MPLRTSPTPSRKRLAARRANALKSTGPRTELGKLRVTGNMRVTGKMERNFRRLLDLPEAVFLDQEPGAAIKLCWELLSPYQKGPPPPSLQVGRLSMESATVENWETTAIVTRLFSIAAPPPILMDRSEKKDPKICTHRSQQVLRNQQNGEKIEKIGTVSKPNQANR